MCAACFVMLCYVAVGTPPAHGMCMAQDSVCGTVCVMGQDGCSVCMYSYSLHCVALIDAGGSGIPRSVRRVERQRTRNRSRFVSFYQNYTACNFGSNPCTPCACAQRERLVHWSYAYAYDAGWSEGATPPPKNYAAREKLFDIKKISTSPPKSPRGKSSLCRKCSYRYPRTDKRSAYA